MKSRIRTSLTLLVLVCSYAGRASEARGSNAALEQAKAVYAQGNFLKAAQLLLAYTEAEPADPEGWFWLGNASLLSSHSQESAEALTRAVLLRPDYVEAYGPLGVAQYQSGNLAAAERTFQLAVGFDTHDERSKCYLGVLSYQHDNPEQGELWLRRAVAEKPRDPLALLYLGLCEEQLQRSREAEAFLQNSVAESIAQHAPLPQAFYSLAELERRKARGDVALALLEQASTLCPDARTLTLLSDLYKEQKRPADAERMLRKAVEMNPGLAEAHYKLALLFKADQKEEEARAELAAFEHTKAQATFPSVVK